MPAKQQPNLLIIMSDEHAPMYSGPYGHPCVQMPHMGRLAEESTGICYAVDSTNQREYFDVSFNK